MRHFEKFLRYLARRECGASARAIIYTLNDVLGVYEDHPVDASDFGRCILLLTEFPDYRLELHHMKTISLEWELLINNWDELEKLYRREVENQHYTGLTTRMIDDLFISIPCVECGLPLNRSYTRINGKRYHFDCKPKEDIGEVE